MTRSKLRWLGAVVALLGSMCAEAADPRPTLVQLEARLGRIGSPHIEGYEKMGGKAVPVLFFGNRKMNGNYDLVDTVRKDFGAVATIFVKDGDEFVRVSTNVMTQEGRRAVGTALARNMAYDAVSRGKTYCGVIDVLGTTFDSCYHPINDSAGKLIAVTYVGLKNSAQPGPSFLAPSNGSKRGVSE